MLEVLLGLRRDIPFSPLPLEFGDELSGCAHFLTIGEFAAGASSAVSHDLGVADGNRLASSRQTIQLPSAHRHTDRPATASHRPSEDRG